MLVGRRFAMIHDLNAITLMRGASISTSKVSQNFRIQTSPTKVSIDNLGPIGNLQKIRCKTRFPMALGSRESRFIHQHRPINMNGRSILSETSIQNLLNLVAD